MDDIITLSTDKVRDLLREVVPSLLRQELPEAVRRGTEKPYLTKSELMQLTGWSSRQVEYRKANRSIPFIRRGRTILFPTDEIYAFLEEGRVKTRMKPKAPE